jgi:putative oxidoreductase
MSTSIQLLIGRVLMSYIFITQGYGKLGGVEGTAGYMASMGIPLPSITVWLVIALELLGGIAILLGFFTRYVSWALAAFCLLAGYLAHYQPSDAMQMISFTKNLAIAGGFLVLAAHGPGALSVDARRKSA